jgi:hypothetical protein
MSKKNDVTQKLQASRRVGELSAARNLPESKQRIKAINRLIRTWIERKVLQQEPALQEMAWAEYRYMSPLERTELFTRLYFDAYVELTRKYFADQDADKKQPVDRDYVRNDPGVMNALWSARAAADALGVPYEEYVRLVMEHLIAKSGWKRLPRPNQLYGKLVGPLMRDGVNQALLLERLYAPGWDPKFKATAYRADPVQETALGLMEQVVNGSADPAETLAEYLCVRQVVTVPKAVELFGQELVDAARNLSPNQPVETPEPTGRHYPSCVGLPDASEDSPCARCPVLQGCTLLAQEVRAELIETTGSDDPRGAWKRHKAKLRQRKHRAGQKGQPKPKTWSEYIEQDVLPTI